MSPDPEDHDPSPDDNNPPPPEDENPPPLPDEAAHLKRLHLLWKQWDQIRSMLLRMARSSNLPPTDGELAVDEVLDRLVAVTVSDNPPDCPFSLGRVVMRRLLGKTRKKGVASRISEDPKQAEPDRLSLTAPGLKEFWEWFEKHARSIESQLTALQWKTLMATKDAPTIESAASRCNQLPINYRNTTERLGKKTSKKIQRGSVPPPS